MGKPFRKVEVGQLCTQSVNGRSGPVEGRRQTVRRGGVGLIRISRDINVDTMWVITRHCR